MSDLKGFPSRSQRKKLLEELRKGKQDPNIAMDAQYKKYLESIENLDKELERLSAPEKGTGVPKALTKDEAGKLAELMRKTAVDGEEYLAYNTLEDGKVKPGMPQVVDKLQSLMAKDHQTLVDYNEEEPKTLPELQETSRTLTIDLRGKKLSTVGNMQNSRIPMTVLDSTGRKRKGFFTKANYFSPKKDFQKIIDNAKVACDTEEQKAALDNFLNNYRMNRTGEKTYSGKMIDRSTSDAWWRRTRTSCWR